MHAGVVRQILYPLHERLRRRPTFRVLAELEASQWYSSDELRSLQVRKLARLFRHYAYTSRHYGRLFKSMDVDPRRDDAFSVLGALPAVSKADLRDIADDVCVHQIPGGVRTMSTAGSTGEPFTFRVNCQREAYDKAARMRTHRWFGVEPGDAEVYIWGAPVENRRQDRLRSIRDFILNDLLLSAFDLAPDRMACYLRRMEAFDPVCLFGYPSSIALLCNWAAGEGRRPRLFRLKAVFVTGEVLDAQQRHAIEAYFGVPVANGYGGRDSGFCAHECPAGSMHVTSEHVIVEILDEQGGTLEAGCVGDIVVTNLDNLATPFIRYRTGDLGVLAAQPCVCGRGLAVLADVRGRRTDHLVAEDGTLRHALAAIYVMRELEGISRFQIRQREDRSIDLVISPAGALREAVRRRAIEGIQRCVGATLPVRIHVNDHIRGQGSGKFRHVVSAAAASPGRVAPAVTVR
jgi:phenylacetate-CoA ligase